MKSRWQESLEAAVAAHDTPMPWARGARRNAMIARRQDKADDTHKSQKILAQRA